MPSPRLLLCAITIAAPLASLAAAPHVQGATTFHRTESPGNLHGLDFEARFTPHRDRAEVRAEAILAAPHFKNEAARPDLDAPSRTSREAVLAEAAAAQRARQIAIGNQG